MFRSPRSLRALATTTAGILAAGAVVLAPAGSAEAYYSAGVKSLTFEPADDACTPGQAVPCTPGAGVGDANVMRVTQSKVGPGQWEYTGLSGTATDPKSLWLAADIAAECRTGYKLFKATIDSHPLETSSLWEDVQEVGQWYFDVSVPSAKSMPEKRIAIDLPIGKAFTQSYYSQGGALISPLVGFDEPLDIYAAGETEIAQRVAGGMAESEARAIPWELNTAVRVRAEVVCRGNSGAHFKSLLDKEIFIPLTIVYEPFVAPVGEAHGVANDLALPQVTSADLTVTTYENGDACTLVLAGTIGTNMTTTVEYRFVNQYGQPSNTHTVQIDDSTIGFVQHEVAIPTLDAPDAQEDLAPVLGGHGPSQGLVDVDSSVDEQYSGTFELQILTPNQMSAVDGFNVDYCPGAGGSSEIVGGQELRLQRG